ncbi:hypothetical protein HU200_001643 [Digitaria exilis]|uniref:KIB1-4 beta-propeller domain-containing protein n=1 Tax=Digitaria exilis TaxID=1010633 RepID=A0A835G042_9POAL|nr:hypothetical protein HU200_001643 [Digitaria exilis]
MSFSLTWKGWILSWDRNDFHTFLYDPWTREEIGLPRFTHDLPRVFDCALSDKPTNPGRIVVILHPDEPYFWYCRIGGMSEWIKYDYDVGMDPADPKGLTWKKRVLHFLRSCNGKFYFPIASVKHGIIEFNPNPVIRIVTMHGFRGGYSGMPRGFRARSCNFELDGEPYKFYVFYEGKLNITSIALYKVDLVQQRFVEVDRIGDQALLWSSYSGGCCPATKFELESSCVYWTRRDDGSMHIFNIAEGTHRVCYQPSQDLPKLSSEAFWLLPSNQNV